MGTQNMPAAEVEITADLVRELLAGQHPDLAELPIRELANGWDNAIYRLGDDLTVRLPRRQMAARLVEHEQLVLPLLAPHLPIPTPAPVRFGVPTSAYPWRWSVNPWFEGRVVAETQLADPPLEAQRLGGFMASLHVAAPADAPQNPYRGHAIAEKTDVFHDRLDDLQVEMGQLVPGGADLARRRWVELTAAPSYEGPPTWLHGDVHTANLLADHGQIAAVIDFGDICSGDPATDLAVAWMLFGEEERRRFRAAAGVNRVVVDDAMWARAEAWALYFAATYLHHSADNPRMGKIGEDLIRTLLA